MHLYVTAPCPLFRVLQSDCLTACERELVKGSTRVALRMSIQRSGFTSNVLSSTSYEEADKADVGIAAAFHPLSFSWLLYISY